MATIRKRGPHSWQVIIKRGRDGRRGIERKTFSTRKQAVVWSVAMAARMQARPDLHSRLAGRRTLGYYVWSAVAARAAVMGCDNEPESWHLASAPYDVRRRAADALRMCTDSLFALPVRRITGRDIADYFTRRLRQCSLSTLKRHDISGIRAAYYVAAQSAALAPCWEDFKLHFARATLLESARREREGSSKQSRRVSPSVEAALIAAARQPQLKIAIVISMETAMRQGELFRLFWRQVDWEKEEIYLAGEQTKNRYARTILLSPRAMSALQDLRKIYPSAKKLFGEWQQVALKSAWRRLKAQVEAGKPVRWHDFRHEAISRWLDVGMPAHVASAASGHNTATVLANYSHAKERAARPYLDLLDQQRSKALK